MVRSGFKQNINLYNFFIVIWRTFEDFEWYLTDFDIFEHWIYTFAPYNWLHTKQKIVRANNEWIEQYDLKFYFCICNKKITNLIIFSLLYWYVIIHHFKNNALPVFKCKLKSFLIYVIFYGSSFKVLKVK